MILQTADGIKLFYETYGEKGNTPVVLVHGAGADSKMWLYQIVKYPVKGLFVIAPDLRGHGNPSKVGSFKIKDCAEDINELLCLSIRNIGLLREFSWSDTKDNTEC